MENSQEQIKIFIAYSHKDTSYLNQLRIYLAPLERSEAVEIWYDGEIKAGKAWDDEIKNELKQADIILLLISANSLYSPYFHDQEMQAALKRHEQNTAIVIPVILSACMWKKTELQNLQALPKNAKPIKSWLDEAEAYTNIGHGIDAILPDARANKKNRIEAERQEQERKRRKAFRKAELERQKRAEEERKRKARLQKQLENYITQARNAFEQGNYDNCIWYAEKAIQIDANNIETQQLKAYAEQTIKRVKYEREKRQREQQEAIAREQAKRQQEAAAEKAQKQKLYEKQETTTEERKDNKVLKFGVPTIIGILMMIFVGNIFLPEETPEQNTQQNMQQNTAKNIKEPKQLTEEEKEIVHTLQANMINVAGGTFRMGCDEKRDGNCRDDEKPVHEVTLSSFQIGKYEVTQEEWQAVMGKNPSRFKDCDKCPVEQVSWNDTQDFLKELNKITDKKYRLLTEAEWEYAARGGKNSKGYKYAGSNTLDEVAWYGENWKEGNTHKVGLKKANELGIYDMSGNVWEWCEDRYDSDFYSENKIVNNNKAAFRVLRGGSWLNEATICRVADRINPAPTNSYDITGFRLASSL